ncbi:hypothetical protein DHD80_08140 [Gramella sp. AN32]|nr:hypothetical protein [Gramella sp. AN32]
MGKIQKNVPDDSQIPIINYYSEKIINGTPAEKKHFSYEWSFYEISIYKKGITKKEVEKILEQIPYESLSILETYYLKNDCFIEENYILDNLKQIEQIPIKIVHGKDDAICPVKSAIELDSRLKNSEIFIVDGGHSDSEPEIEKKLIEILNKNVW